MRKELWFGFSIMGLITASVLLLTPWSDLSNGHLGLIMLALVVVAIMLGFPTAFTLMGMGMFFTYLAYQSSSPDLALQQSLDLMVQRAYAVMTNDVLISIPLFVFMGYLVERANLIAQLFRALQLALAWLPGSLGVATLVTCAIFATATGIVGAVVTLMGLLAYPAMLKAGYSAKVGAGAITAGGCLGILIPPSVLLIVYGATAGVSVVQLYAGAFFPGIMLASLYILYIVVLATIRPDLMPPLPKAERTIPLPADAEGIRDSFGDKVLPALGRLFTVDAKRRADYAGRWRLLGVSLLPLLVTAGVIGLLGNSVFGTPDAAEEVTLQESGFGISGDGFGDVDMGSGLSTLPEVEEPPLEMSSGLSSLEPLPGAEETAVESDALPTMDSSVTPLPGEEPAAATTAEAESTPVPAWFWITAGTLAAIMVAFYGLLTWARLELFRMLLRSFVPLAILIISVLGSIVFGLATPTEAAAVGALGGGVLALAYRRLTYGVVKESVFLTGKTTAMVCWLFVGSSIFSAAFALLGGQELVENWVLSLGLTKLEFLILSQVIIFLLGWPLEWTEIIVIFMPIFIPLLDNFGVDPLFFGLLVAINLQTAFLSPPVAMSAFYLKGVAPPHVTLNQIFAGMLPFMGIQIVALVLLYAFPGIGMWLPEVLYR